MNDKPEVRELTLDTAEISALFRVHPYVIIQLNPTSDGGHCIYIDYRRMTAEEAALLVREALDELGGEQWIEN